MSGKVFVSQQSYVRDRETGAVKSLDLSDALRFGDLCYIFGGGNVALQPELVVDAIEDRLDEEQYNPETDYLLATGDMTLGIQTAVAMWRRGGCRVLRWDKRNKLYTVYNVGVTE